MCMHLINIFVQNKNKGKKKCVKIAWSSITHYKLKFPLDQTLILHMLHLNEDRYMMNKDTKTISFLWVAWSILPLCLAINEFTTILCLKPTSTTNTISSRIPLLCPTWSLVWVSDPTLSHFYSKKIYKKRNYHSFF